MIPVGEILLGSFSVVLEQKNWRVINKSITLLPILTTRFHHLLPFYFINYLPIEKAKLPWSVSNENMILYILGQLHNFYMESSLSLLSQKSFHISSSDLLEFTILRNSFHAAETSESKLSFK